jgi:hypothetical protein
VFEPHLFGWDSPTRDIAATVGVVVFLIATRWLAFPASIWEQDEAYFATAVLAFDPTANHPHPPWFPLWIGLGKLVHGFVGDPGRALQLLGAAFSVWMVFPLTSLWSLMMDRTHALLATLVFLHLPGIWLLSGSGFTETAATSLLVCAGAFWFGRPADRGLIAGSIAAGCCVLIRPHFLVAVLPMLVVALRPLSWRRTATVIGPAAILGGVAAAWLLATAGVPELIEAVRAHGSLHFGQLAAHETGFAQSGIARIPILTEAAIAWCVLAAVGAFKLFSGRQHAPREVLISMVLPILFALVFLHNSDHPRYSIPVYAVSSGFVVFALAGWIRRWIAPAAAIVIAVSATVSWSALEVRRTVISPPVAAIDAAIRAAEASGSVIVLDRTLISFFELRQEQQPTTATWLLDSKIGRETAPPPDWATVAVYDDVTAVSSAIASRNNETTFRVDDRVTRRISQRRFLDVTVASEAALQNRPIS